MINIVIFFASVLVFSLGVWALGQVVLWWGGIRPQRSLFVLAWGTGISVLVPVLTGLGLCGWFRPEVLFWVWSGLLVMGAVSLFIWMRRISITHEPIERNPDWVMWISQIGTYVMLALCFMTVMTPETRHDPYDYHLMIPALYLQEGGITEIPWHVFAYMPKNTEMLYGLALAVGDDTLTKLIHFLFGCFGLLVIAEWAEMGFKRSGTWMTVFLIASVPLFGFIATSSYIDLALGFWQLLALFCLAKLFDANNDIHPGVLFCLSAWFAGMALGTKYTAYAVFFPAYGLCALYSLKQVKHRLLTALCALLLLPIPALAWWSTNAVWTLNPLYPLLPQWFGYHTPAAYPAYLFFRGHAPGAEIFHPDAVFPYFGMRLHRFLLDGNSLFLIGMGGGLLYPWLRKKTDGVLTVPFQGGLLFFIALSTAAFFVATDNHDGRFFYATLALLAIPGTQLLLSLQQQAVEHKTVGWALLPFILIFFFVNGISYRFGQLNDQRETIFPILTPDMREDWLRHHFQDYPIIYWGNANLPDDAVVLGMGYPLQRRFISKIKYGYLPGWPAETAEREPERIIKHLKKIGVTHFVMPNDFFRFTDDKVPAQLHTLFQHRGKTVYQITP